jgi:hypothetical protein
VIGVEIAARCRAEKIEPQHMKAAAQRLQFLAMQLDFVDHGSCRYAYAASSTRTLSRWLHRTGRTS